MLLNIYINILSQNGVLWIICNLESAEHTVIDFLSIVLLCKSWNIYDVKY